MKKNSILIIGVLILFLASCGKQYSSKIKGFELEDLNFGSKFKNPQIASLRMQIYNSTVYGFEGDLYDQGQVYSFIIDDDKINYLWINETEIDELGYFTFEEIKSILSNVNTFVKNEFQLSSYNVRLFSGSHNISILDENLLVYEYFNGNFLITTEVFKVKTTCLFLYGNDTFIIILLNN